MRSLQNRTIIFSTQHAVWCRFIIDKYWNWCRCIQRKDSAGVILTASWFNDINIGYRFHISTVCHSCCNNVMYVFFQRKSGYKWLSMKKISCWHGVPAGTDCPGTEIIYTGRELCSPHASISSQITTRFWHIIYDIYWYLHYISMIVINVYIYISWCSVPSSAYTSCHVTTTPLLCQNNIAMTFGVIMTLLLRHLYVVIYKQRFACRAVYT